ncbi:DNA polymerase III subunit epsilon [Acrasis kona]|uniref:DNA polymerase III subunit epsilon n=1 Tax=Acrasis kona TaxID=1008807 RepID=A0AAW2YR89_9EUKA
MSNTTGKPKRKKNLLDSLGSGYVDQPKKTVQTLSEEEVNSVITQPNILSPYAFDKKMEVKDKKRKSEDHQELSKRIKLDSALEEEFCEFHQTNLSRLVVFDVETTGFSKDDQIIEIGAIEIVNGRITGNMFHSMIRLPEGLVVNKHAKTVHNISEELLLREYNSQYYDSKEVLSRFLSFVNGCALVAHNLAFDERMLRQDAVKNGLEQILLKSTENSFCTMSFFKRAFSNKSCDLDSVCFYFGVDSSVRDRFGHNALSDAMLTAKIFVYYDELVRCGSEMKTFKNQVNETPNATNKDV